MLLTITLAAVSSWGQTPAAPKDSGPIPYLKLSEPRHILPAAQAWERNEFPHTMSVLEYNHDGFRYWGWYGLNEGEGIGLARSKEPEGLGKVRPESAVDQCPLAIRAGES